MTPSVLAGQSVSVEFDQLAGATALEYEVRNGDGAPIVTRQSLTVADSVTITVPPLSNDLVGDEIWAVREVVLFVTGLAGIGAISTKSSAYRIVADDQLPVPQFSFSSLALAEAVADDLVGLTHWSVATAPQRTAALRDAFEAIAGMRFQYIPDDYQSRVLAQVEYQHLFELTNSEWESMDTRFKRALRRAQVLQANSLLRAGTESGSGVDDPAVTEITVGESTRKFSAGARVGARTLDTRALQVLAPFMCTPRVGRA